VNSFAVLYLTKNSKNISLQQEMLEVQVCNQNVLEQDTFVYKTLI
jgi:hypothetical protein